MSRLQEFVQQDGDIGCQASEVGMAGHERPSSYSQGIQ